MIETIVMALGAGAFGFLLGWYVYYINRYRKSDVQLSDLTTLVGIIGGGSVTALFPGQGPLFGAYGIGLLLGFLTYFAILIFLVKRSPNFDSDWFLDGRRKRAIEPFFIPGEVAQTIRPLGPRRSGAGLGAGPRSGFGVFGPQTAVQPLAKELSGSLWCARFPASRSTADLTPEFHSSVNSFITSLRAAGATVSISATYRPPKRAYLMHYAFQIARLGMDPRLVPAMNGVEIEWVHRDASGNPDLAISRRAVEDMVATYGMVQLAALTSRHTEGRAIDMTIGWTGTLTLKNALGHDVAITTPPHDGSNPDLHKVGRSFGVMKLVSDLPHWSDDQGNRLKNFQAVWRMSASR